MAGMVQTLMGLVAARQDLAAVVKPLPSVDWSVLKGQT
jgi:hypothetical protein